MRRPGDGPGRGAPDDVLGDEETFLQSLDETIAAIGGLHEETEILERLVLEARKLFASEEAHLLAPGEPRREENGAVRLGLAARGEPIGTLVLDRAEGFAELDLIRARLLVDFAARAVENARLLVEAREREAERARLTEQVITAEQDERRRLSLFLHDGPLQQMSGIALMHDAALAAIEDGRYEDAARVVRSSLERERDTIRALRDLTFAIEPLVLRDHGLAAAVRALGDQIERAERVTVSANVEAGERLGERLQVALYQIVRETLTQAVGRRPRLIEVAVAEQREGGFALEISDDGMGERRRASIEAIDERVRVLNGRLTVGSGDQGGTVVRVAIPAYVAAARD